VIDSLPGLLILISGTPVALSCLYLLVLALASLWHRHSSSAGEPRSRLVVVVPAHNESEMIGDCVHSLLDQSYPAELYRVVVVADNCTDETAEVARAAGAEVLVRHVPELRGKGHALRWAIDLLLKGPTAPDALVVVDADSRADRQFLEELEAVYAAGHPVVQADDVLRTDPGRPRTLLEAAALLLRNRVRFAGRAVFKMPALLCGNGMLFSKDVLVNHPWQAFSVTEDSEYALHLLNAGLPTTFAAKARVVAAPTEGGRGAYTQSLRWEGGRLALARSWLRPLLAAALRRRDPGILSVALDLAIPPLGMLVLAALAGSVLAVALSVSGVTGGSWLFSISWLTALVALPTYVLVGLVSCRVPSATYAAFMLTPLFLLQKVRVYVHLLTGGPSQQQWVRTERRAETAAAAVPRSHQGEPDTR
jgi:cellulose synthase/poly-beta-1,6-N-acetylglucosamine synthase-like glycosyltransferase